MAVLAQPALAAKLVVVQEPLPIIETVGNSQFEKASMAEQSVTLAQERQRICDVFKNIIETNKIKSTGFKLCLFQRPLANIQAQGVFGVIRGFFPHFDSVDRPRASAPNPIDKKSCRTAYVKKTAAWFEAGYLARIIAASSFLRATVKIEIIAAVKLINFVT